MGAGERKAIVAVLAVAAALLGLLVFSGGGTDADAAAKARAAELAARRDLEAARLARSGARPSDGSARSGPTLRAGSSTQSAAELARQSARAREAAEAARRAQQRGAGAFGDGEIVAVDYAYSNRDPDFAEREAEIDPRDRRCLDRIISDNRLTEASSAFDFDNGDGVLSATELGVQRYCNGRLRELRLGPTSYGTFGYQVPVLPDCIEDLDGLIVLEVNSVGLQELPRAIGRLPNLMRVAASQNALTSVPVELADAPALRQLELGENELSEIPAEVAASGRLDLLVVAANPLDRVPRIVREQNEAMMRGELQIPDREIGPLDASCRPQG